VQEQRQLGLERGGQLELGGERVQLNLFGAVVQPVVVEAELAEGDEGGGGASWGVGRPSLVDQGLEV